MKPLTRKIHLSIIFLLTTSLFSKWNFPSEISFKLVTPSQRTEQLAALHSKLAILMKEQEKRRKKLLEEKPFFATHAKNVGAIIGGIGLLALRDTEGDSFILMLAGAGMGSIGYFTESYIENKFKPQRDTVVKEQEKINALCTQIQNIEEELECIKIRRKLGPLHELDLTALDDSSFSLHRVSKMVQHEELLRAKKRTLSLTKKAIIANEEQLKEAINAIFIIHAINGLVGVTAGAGTDAGTRQAITQASIAQGTAAAIPASLAHDQLKEKRDILEEQKKQLEEEIKDLQA